MEKPKKSQSNLLTIFADGSRERPYETVLPLANELGLTVE